MDKKELISSISYCGLLCSLCHLAGKCEGCKTAGSNCTESESGKGCYHKNCYINKGIDGCWECEDFPCDKQMFAGRTKGEIKGFCEFIKEYGTERFVYAITLNQEKGIKYGIEGYGDKDEREVIGILRDSIL